MAVSKPGTDAVPRHRMVFFILLAASSFSMFMLATNTPVFPYSVRTVGIGYMSNDTRPRVHIQHKTYTNQPEVAVTACSHSSRLCSESAIRDCLLASERFPRELRWTNTSVTFPGAGLEPRFCRYKHDVMPPELLQRCLQRKRIRRIAIIGDSQGNIYNTVLKEMLATISICTKVRSDFWDLYFNNNNNFTKKRRHRRAVKKLPKARTHRRLNELYECVFINVSDHALPRSVFIEMISVTSFTDKKLTDPAAGNSTKPPPGAKQRPTPAPRMQYPTMFGEYFAREHYPDVIMLFANSHDKGMGKTLEKTRADMTALRDVIRRHVPRSTAFYWFSQMCENDEKRKKEWKNILYEDKYTANEMLARTNLAMYEVLRDDVREGRIRTFFDLYAMTFPVRHWSIDGIHFRRPWYNYLLSYWWQTTCSEFM